jgi:hypothetical protein
LELLIEGGQGLPEFRSLDEHRANPDFEGAVWAVIEVPVERYFGPAEKINITVPSLTLKRIDEHAVQRGETRSGFLVRALKSRCEGRVDCFLLKGHEQIGIRHL